MEPGDGGKETVSDAKTKIKKKTINPNWDEEFTFNVKPGTNNILFEGKFNFSKTVFFILSFQFSAIIK